MQHHSLILLPPRQRHGLQLLRILFLRWEFQNPRRYPCRKRHSLFLIQPRHPQYRSRAHLLRNGASVCSRRYALSRALLRLRDHGPVPLDLQRQWPQSQNQSPKPRTHFRIRGLDVFLASAGRRIDHVQLYRNPTLGCASPCGFLYRGTPPRAHHDGGRLNRILCFPTHCIAREHFDSHRLPNRDMSSGLGIPSAHSPVRK